MKTSELLERLVHVVDTQHDDGTVVVNTANLGCPHQHLAAVSSVGPGFDWTHGRLIINTVEPLVLQRKMDRPVRELAVERLARTEHQYRCLGQVYLGRGSKVRDAWIDGFAAGARLQFTEEVTGG